MEERARWFVISTGTHAGQEAGVEQRINREVHDPQQSSVTPVERL